KKLRHNLWFFVSMLTIFEDSALTKTSSRESVRSFLLSFAYAVHAALLECRRNMARFPYSPLSHCMLGILSFRTHDEKQFIFSRWLCATSAVPVPDIPM